MTLGSVASVQLHKTRRLWPTQRTWRAALASSLVAGLALLGSGPASADFKADWDKLVEAAKKEGKVAIATGGAPSRQYAPMFEAFNKAFGIDVEVSRGNANTTISRVIAERTAGRNTMDVALISIRIHNQRLVPTKALLPFESLLIHPDVVDKKNWHAGKYWFGDKDQKYVFLYASAIIEGDKFWYNTEKVSDADVANIKSLWDFLKPEWKGKVQGQAMDDPSGIRQMIDAWQRKDLGPEWVKKYLTGGNVTFSADRRILETWLVKGRYPLKAVSTSEEELKALAEKGIPIKQVSLPRKVPILQASGSGCCISAFADGPHPNAAKLFVNWFLSKEGQTLMQATIPYMDRSSMRSDVPAGQVSKEHLRVAGTTYDYPDSDPNAAEADKVAQDEVMKIWKSLQR